MFFAACLNKGKKYVRVTLLLKDKTVKTGVKVSFIHYDTKRFPHIQISLLALSQAPYFQYNRSNRLVSCAV